MYKAGWWESRNISKDYLPSSSQPILTVLPRPPVYSHEVLRCLHPRDCPLRLDRLCANRSQAVRWLQLRRLVLDIWEARSAVSPRLPASRQGILERRHFQRHLCGRGWRRGVRHVAVVLPCLKLIRDVPGTTPISTMTTRQAPLTPSSAK